VTLTCKKKQYYLPGVVILRQDLIGDMPMIEKMSESSGPVAGYKVEGKVTPDDYRQLEPEVKALADKYDTISVLLDLQEFTGEEVKAWLPDLKFGHHFHDKIAKMAIVGDKRWEKWMTALVDPFYAKEGKFFHPDEIDKAWAWLGEEA
jgi:predicted transcriptional regulator